MMTLHDRFALTARIATCVVAGSIAGFVAWSVCALGLGCLLWALPLVVTAALFFGLPSFGLTMAVALLFARSIHRHTAGWCLALPLLTIAGWRASPPPPGFALQGAMLVAACAITSSALFLAWSRYPTARRPAGGAATSRASVTASTGGEHRKPW